jgi:hypothetical protein
MTKFDNYLKEIVGSVAYWISPRGEVLEVGTNHIAVVIKNPKSFGLTTEKIKEVYDRHGEPMGMEGNAREEIILNLLNKGFIRIRRYKNAYSLNIGKMSKKVKDILQSWAYKLINKGINGMKEKDVYMPINIQGFNDHFNKSLTIKEVAEDALFEGTESFDPENTVIIVESAEDFTYEPTLLDGIR